MKISVGKSYIDGAGVTVRVVHKLKKFQGDSMYVGVIEWDDVHWEADLYSDFGRNDRLGGGEYDLIKLKKTKKRRAK